MLRTAADRGTRSRSAVCEFGLDTRRDIKGLLHTMATPPLGRITWPVMKLLASEAR